MPFIPPLSLKQVLCPKCNNLILKIGNVQVQSNSGHCREDLHNQRLSQFVISVPRNDDWGVGHESNKQVGGPTFSEYR